MAEEARIAVNMTAVDDSRRQDLQVAIVDVLENLEERVHALPVRLPPDGGRLAVVPEVVCARQQHSAP